MVITAKYFFGRWADWIVWAAGAICFLLLFYFTSYRYTERKNGRLDAVSNNVDNAEQLFLANDEFGFEDKKSFVLGTLRFQWTSGQSLASGNDRQHLYQYIYQKKITNKFRKPAQNKNFSIRPVPK